MRKLIFASFFLFVFVFIFAGAVSATCLHNVYNCTDETQHFDINHSTCIAIEPEYGNGLDWPDVTYYFYSDACETEEYNYNACGLKICMIDCHEGGGYYGESLAVYGDVYLIDCTEQTDYCWNESPCTEFESLNWVSQQNYLKNRGDYKKSWGMRNKGVSGYELKNVE